MNGNVEQRQQHLQVLRDKESLRDFVYAMYNNQHRTMRYTPADKFVIEHERMWDFDFSNRRRLGKRPSVTYPPHVHDRCDRFAHFDDAILVFIYPFRIELTKHKEVKVKFDYNNLKDQFGYDFNKLSSGECREVLEDILHDSGTDVNGMEDVIVTDNLVIANPHDFLDNRIIFRHGVEGELMGIMAKRRYWEALEKVKEVLFTDFGHMKELRERFFDLNEHGVLAENIVREWL